MNIYKKNVFTAVIALSVTLAPLSLASAATQAPGQKAPANKSTPAQSGSQSQGGESWRKNPPTLPEHRPLQMPSPVSFKLQNGLQVLLMEDHRVPFVTAQLGIKAGAAYEDEGKHGLASMTADLLNEGTTTKSSKQIADEIDFIGGALRAASDADFTLIGASSLSKYKDRLFTTLADVLINPAFPEDELKLEKTNLLQELIAKRAEPGFLMEERFKKVVFGKHPYSVVAPTPQNVESITRADLQKFHSEHYVPNESVLVVVGDFNADEMKKLITEKLGPWKQGQLNPPTIAQPPERKGRRIFLVDRPGSVQSNVKIGNLAVSRSDPDYYTVEVANQILGGAAFSRLFMNIRENKGYTYGAYSGFMARKMPGEFAASAAVRTPVTGDSIQEFLYELDKMRTTRPTAKEIETAKKYIIGNFQMGLETQGGVAQKLLEQQIYDLPADYLQTYADKIAAVTADDIRRVAHKHIDTDDLTITVVGDAKQLRDELQFFGPIEVYDATGQLVTGETATKLPGS